MSKKMRIFIALELPEEIKREISKIQKNLKKENLKARWLKPEDTHLTLAFLGSITPDKISLIKKIIRQTVPLFSSISLKFSEISCFPNLKKAKIVFIGLEGEIKKLQNLTNNIRRELKKLDIWFDKKSFLPHLTLGRLKKSQNLSLLISKTKISKLKFSLNKISLNQSLLFPSGPSYKKIALFSLSKPKNLIK